MRTAAIAATDRPTMPITWRVHPARERIGAACLTAIVILAAASLSAVLMESFWWAVVACLMTVLPLRNFFFPSEFTVDERGVTARQPLRTLHYRWSDVRRFLHDARGGFLSPRARGSAFDLFRGMHLVFGEERELVVETIRRGLADRKTSNAGEALR